MIISNIKLYSRIRLEIKTTDLYYNEKMSPDHMNSVLIRISGFCNILESQNIKGRRSVMFECRRKTLPTFI